MKRERLEAITDAILAIIITLMVLAIKIPALRMENAVLVVQQIGIYALSFIYIAILWLNHHHLFANIARVPMRLVWMNFGLLFVTSLLPTATEHLSEDFSRYENHIFFAVVMSLLAGFYALVEAGILRESGDEHQGCINFRNFFSLICFFLAIPLSMQSVWYSGAIFVLIPSMYAVISFRERSLDG